MLEGALGDEKISLARKDFSVLVYTYVIEGKISDRKLCHPYSSLEGFSGQCFHVCACLKKITVARDSSTYNK